MLTTAPLCALLATDQHASVLRQQQPGGRQPAAYCPFGFHAVGLPALLSGFNGQSRERGLEVYLLGNGYRAFSTVLQRFHSPDSLSPFGEGGLNGYGYCAGDPINWMDPTGHWPLSTLLKGPRKLLKFVQRSRSAEDLVELIPSAVARGTKPVSVGRPLRLLNPSSDSNALSLQKHLLTETGTQLSGKEARKIAEALGVGEGGAFVEAVHPRIQHGPRILSTAPKVAENIPRSSASNYRIRRNSDPGSSQA